MMAAVRKVLVIVGAAAGYGLWANRRSRSEQLADRERDRSEATANRQWRERRDAYGALLGSVNACAHRLGNLSRNQYGKPPDDRQGAAYEFDTKVTPCVHVVHLVGTAEASAAARTLQETLREFRDYMTTADTPPDYRTAAYDGKYRPVWLARNAFLNVAAREPGGTPLPSNDYPTSTSA